MLLAAVVLKFVPTIVTVDPTGPDTGENEVMVGTCAKVYELTTKTIAAKVFILSIPSIAFNQEHVIFHCALYHCWITAVL
jgi:hypothetical protein